MNDEIEFALEYLKNRTNDDTLATRYIKYIEEYIDGLIYCINNNNLQSKIDKAIEYIEEHTDKLKTIRIPKTDFNYERLLDILKDDK